MVDAVGFSPGLVATMPTEAAAPPVAPMGDFGATLEAAVSRVDGVVAHGDDALSALASGREVDLHGAMIALEEAEIALRALVTVRDKAMNAYEQLMNLPV